MVEPLVGRTPAGDLVPRLAEAVPTFANGGLGLESDPGGQGTRLVARFWLRAGLVWHDGAPITASDVAFAFRRDRDAPAGSVLAGNAARIESVSAADERTAVVTYRAGERWDGYALAPRALPAHLLTDAASEEAYRARPVHAGPYRIVARTPGRILLEPFARYWAGPPRIGHITVAEYPDPGALLAAVRAGEIDVAPSPGFGADVATLLERTVDQRAYSVRETPALAVATLHFGARFADGRVRRAMALAIDRERIARAFFSGRVRVPGSYLVAPLPDAAELAARPADPEAAGALMAAAGFSRGNLGIAERAGERMVLRLLVPEGDAALVAVAGSVVVDLAGLGIAVDVAERPEAEVRRAVATGDHDLALTLEPADDALIATLTYRGRVDPWYDVLADAAAAKADPASRRELYLGLQREWASAHAALPIYQPIWVDVVSRRIEGVDVPPQWTPMTWNVAAWTVRGP